MRGSKNKPARSERRRQDGEVGADAALTGDVVADAVRARAQITDLMGEARRDAERLLGADIVAAAIDNARLGEHTSIESPDEQRLRWMREEGNVARALDLLVAADRLREELRRQNR